MTDVSEKKRTGARTTDAISPAPVRPTSTGNGENPWSEAERTLEQAISIAKADAVRSHEEWQESLAGLFEDWRRFLNDVAARHEEHSATLNTRRPDEKSLPREVIGEYRRAFTRDVIEPLVEIGAGNHPPVDISRRFRQLVDAVAQLPDEFPENVRLLEPRSLYAQVEGDPVWVGLRKRLHRMRLSVADTALRTRNLAGRVLRRRPARRLPASRVVPARNLAGYHLRQQLPDELIREHSDAHDRLATIVETLERLIAEWVNGVLAIAREADPDLEASSLSVSWDEISVEGGSSATGRSTRDVDAADAVAGADELNDEGEATEDDEEDEASLFEELLDHSAAFQSGLVALAAQTVPPEPVAPDRLTDVFVALAEDIRRSGTFLLRAPDRVVEEVPRAVRTLEADRQRSIEWYGQVDQRMRYYRHLMALRDKLVALERELVRSVGQATVEPVLSTFADMSSRLEEVRRESAAAADVARRKDDHSPLAESIDTSTTQLVDFVQQVFKHLPGLVSSDQALADPARNEWDDLSRFVETLPERVRMHSLQGEMPAHRNPKATEIEMRTLVGDVLEPPLPDRLRRPAEQLRSAVRRVWTETEQVQHIVQYNLDAALDELTGSGEDEDGVPGPDDEIDSSTANHPVDSAEKLVVEGLARASMTLVHQAATLRPAWSSFVAAVDHEFRQDWRDVHRRLHSADTAEEQWAGFRAHLGRQLDRAVDRARLAGRRLRDTAARIFTVGRRRAESLIKIGQSAVGVLDTGENVRYETIDALTTVKTLRETLPLIYRRLFSFEPLDETSLLEGRARDLVWVKQHFTRWKDAHQVGVLLIMAPIGSGRTSFLNALRDTVLSEYEIRHINLRERVYNPDEFASVVAPELGQTRTDVTLEELEEWLIETPRSDPPHVCFIDNIEHLVMRAPQGGDTLERIILFLSRTDRSVYWIGTVGTHTWQYLSKTSGTAVGFVDSYPLTPLDRDAIESLIINRHRRSGMTLHFVEPSEASALLRQRLKRAKSPEQRQELAREDFFDRLWRASGQNVMLALFNWIRSAQFNEDDSTLTVQPLKSLRFDFLNDLSLDHAFTLKAFFLHKTLSLADHSRIFHISDAESTAILESLLNLHLVEEVPLAERHPREDYHVVRDAVYRVRPLLIHPVTTYLQSKNIVY